MSWSVATTTGYFRGDGRNLSSLVGNWSKPSNPIEFTSQWIARISVMDDVRLENGEVLPEQTGFIFTLQELLVDAISFSPTAAPQPPDPTFTFLFESNGMIFEVDRVTGQTAFVQALSVLLGGVTGMMAFFSFLLLVFERTSSWLVRSSGRTSLNFADVPLDRESDMDVEVVTFPGQEFIK